MPLARLNANPYPINSIHVIFIAKLIYSICMGYLVRWLAYLGLCTSVVLLGVSFWYEAVLNSQLLPQVAANKELQSQSLKKYLQDRSWLEQNIMFSNTRPREKNLQDFLFQIKTRYGNNVLDEHPVLYPLFLDREIKGKILALNENWIEKSHHLRDFEIDLSLFENISNYDYWNISEPYIQWEQNIDPFNLILSSKIFVLKSIRDHRPAELILNRIRKMATLLASVDDLDFKLCSLSVLKIEAEVSEYFNKRAPTMAARDWKLVSTEEIAQIRRTLHATSGYLEPWTSPEILETVFLSQKNPIVFCAAYKSKQKKLEKLKPLFAHYFPFEISFSKSQEKLQLIANKYLAECQSAKENKTLSEAVHSKLSELPFFRRLTGIQLAVRDMHPYQEYLN